MKNLVYYFAVSLLGCVPMKKNFPEYVKFTQIGIIRHSTRPLVIDTKHIDFKLTEEQISYLEKIKYPSKVKQNDIENYANSLYHQVTTDELTLSNLLFFIEGHREFYLKDLNNLEKIPGESYEININGSESFVIDYKKKDAFLISLITYLNGKKCDQNVVLELDDLR